METLIELSLAAQVAAGAGYASYAIAYAGYRRHHGTRDAVFLSLAFGVPSLVVFQFVDSLGPVFSTLLAVLACLSLGAAWRALGRKASVKLLSALKVHRDDGLYFGWDEVVQTPATVGQVSVHLKNGGVLYQNDRRQFSESPWSGLYLGGDGSVILAVEEEELPDGSEEVRHGVTDPVWGTRMTYVPAGEIARVNIRMTK